jgi:hypothetical protein
MGINIQKDIHTGETQYKTSKQNYGEGKACTGGPKCKYNGKEIPCFVGCSYKASITAEMLAEMLSYLMTTMFTIEAAECNRC